MTIAAWVVVAVVVMAALWLTVLRLAALEDMHASDEWLERIARMHPEPPRWVSSDREEAS